MNDSQLYIGADNGVVVCVNQMRESRIAGRFYHAFSTEPVGFYSWEQLIFEIEELLNQLYLPFPSTNDRYFVSASPKPLRKEKRVKTVTDDELLRHRGSLGSFIIKVQHRENSTWQGRITWVDENKTVSFRSVWEMMKLMENALDTACQPEDRDSERGWND